VLSHLFRKSLLAAVVTGVGLVGMTAAPAGAVGALGGLVTGSVALVPGLPTGNVCSAEAFTFAPITLAGAALEGTNLAVGAITTSIVTGGTSNYPLPLPPPVGCPNGQENGLAATGTINAFTFTGTTAVVGSINNGNCGGGSYTRIGVVVLVDLTGCSLDVNGPAGHSVYGPLPSSTDIRVAALFLPDVTKGSNGVTTPIKDAIFAGAFGGATLT
jgi:hypothetical protein